MTQLNIRDIKFWTKVYDIIIEECGATPTDKFHFLGNKHDFIEWRFQGKLGFGGKLWNNNYKIYVSCYPEDLNNERQNIIDTTNKKLEQLLFNYTVDNI